VYFAAAPLNFRRREPFLKDMRGLGAAASAAKDLAASPLSVEDELDRALDALSGVVRTYGALALDIEGAPATETDATCQRLARNLTMGPSRDEEDESPSPAGALKRDFGSVRRFVEKHRKEEHAYFQRSSTNLRQTLQAFAQCLTATMAEDREGDRRVEAQLTQFVTTVAKGAPDELEKQLGALVSLVRANIDRRREREVKHRQELGKQVVKLKAELDSARSQAARDPLTQLFNRAALGEELERVTAIGSFLAQPPCLVLLDVDHFKNINDQFGHATGDAMLKLIADNIARHFMRREDLAARYGGEEFAVLVCDSTLQRSIERADRLREALRLLELPPPVTGASVTLSIGVAPLLPAESPKAWLDRADKALYAAKRAGRDRTEVAT
jgi:diguanylate cyclase (GGDEF)-like protein